MLAGKRFSQSLYAILAGSCLFGERSKKNGIAEIILANGIGLIFWKFKFTQINRRPSFHNDIEESSYVGAPDGATVNFKHMPF